MDDAKTYTNPRISFISFTKMRHCDNKNRKDHFEVFLIASSINWHVFNHHCPPTTFGSLSRTHQCWIHFAESGITLNVSEYNVFGIDSVYAILDVQEFINTDTNKDLYDVSFMFEMHFYHWTIAVQLLANEHAFYN